MVIAMNEDTSGMAIDDPAADEALFELAVAVRAAGYRFVTVTPETHRRVNSRSYNRWARSLEDVFGWTRPFVPSVLPPGFFEKMQSAGVLAQDGEHWRSRVRLSTLHGQCFLHSAYPTRDVDSVFFGPDTYRFADAVLTHLAGRAHLRRAVDIGCGAGPGGILIALAAPSAEVFLVDINESALRFAGINARLAGVANVHPLKSDLLSEVDGVFDLIVANPPYLNDPAGRAYRHGGGALGANLSLAIADLASSRLAPGGTLLLYTGAAIVDGTDPVRAELKKRLSKSGLDWSYRELDPDVFGEELEGEIYAGADRIAAVLLIVNKQG
jgi:methylase of polypeptide subunit release factors